MSKPNHPRPGVSRLAMLAWLAIASPATGLVGDDGDLFKDGFETGSLCRWSSEPDCTCGPDAYEPNASEPAAANLGSLDDCAASSFSVPAVLADGADTDFFHFQGDDVFGSGCAVNPSVAVSSSADARVCVFVECNEGDTELTCPAGTTDAVSPNGRPGCCATGDVPEIDLSCTGFGDDSADVFVRVDQAAEVCTHYGLVIRF